MYDYIHGTRESSPAGSDPVAIIERALMTMRRDQQARRLQRGGPGGARRAARPSRRPEARHPRSGPQPRRGGPVPAARRARVRSPDRLGAGRCHRRRPAAREQARRGCSGARTAASRRRPAGCAPRRDRADARGTRAPGGRPPDAARGGRDPRSAAFSSEETAQFAELLDRFVAAWPRDGRGRAAASARTSARRGTRPAP